ncbi:MAG TPA: S1C family serine protease [Ktedonobacteraceae bacterium]|nr:S1C family serine protease [Ktedonobacteraceae bacterium]
MACLMLLGLAGTAPAAYADGPGGNVSDPVIRAVDIAKPAVVRIITVLNGQLTVHFSPTQSVTFPQGGNGYPIGLSGSGTFITAQGDILTADHVINPPHADLDQFLQQQAAQDVANYMNQTLKVNPPITPDQVTAELASGQLASDTQYSTPQSQVYLSTDFTGPLNVQDIRNVPANQVAPVDKIEKESAVNQSDVAIIHVSNMNDLAMVQLGNSSNVQQQDNLTIIGFPGNGDIAGNSATDLLTLSVNKVFVSSMKTTDTGAPVIQVGGNVEHGDSGGPALDDQGNIVGIVSFGAAGPGSTSFLQASNSAQTLVQSLGLNTTPGPFQNAWLQAFTDYASSAPGHWHKAQQELQQIAAHYPQFKAITPYLGYANTQAKTEKVSQSTPQPSSTGSTSPGALTNNLAIIGGVVVVVLALLLFGAVALSRRRRKRVPVTTTPARLSNIPPAAAQNRPLSPSQSTYGPQINNGLTPFGAPPQRQPQPQVPPSSWHVQPPVQAMPGQSQAYPRQPVPTGPPTYPTNSPTVPSNPSGTLVTWPCGHMNRAVARYCSVCGEPAPPTPTVRRYEQ